MIAGIRPEDLSDPGPGGGAGEQLVHFHLDAQRVRDESELRGQLGPGQKDPARQAPAQELPAANVAAESQGEMVAAAVASGVARIDPRARIRPHSPAVLAVDVERLHFLRPGLRLAIT